MMTDLTAGQSFIIDDQLISEFPWYDLGLIKRCTIDCNADCLPTVELTIPLESYPHLVAFLKLQTVSVCKLPEIGYRRLQFSHMMVQNVRDRQIEDVKFEIYDENFHEPLIQFKLGEVHIQPTE